MVSYLNSETISFTTPTAPYPADFAHNQFPERINGHSTPPANHGGKTSEILCRERKTNHEILSLKAGWCLERARQQISRSSVEIGLNVYNQHSDSPSYAIFFPEVFLFRGRVTSSNHPGPFLVIKCPEAATTVLKY